MFEPYNDSPSYRLVAILLLAVLGEELYNVSTDFSTASTYEALYTNPECQLSHWFHYRKMYTTFTNTQIKLILGGWNQIKHGAYINIQIIS